MILVLIMGILLIGCTEKKTPEIQDYKIELNSYELEKGKLNLEISSEKELQKTRIEIIDAEKKVNCFDYIDLKKGKNDVSIDCQKIKTEILLEITPSDGKTKDFKLKIKIQLKDKITLKKGFKYEFKFSSPETKETTTKQELFIMDENKQFQKAILHSIVKGQESFDMLLINKEKNEIYSSGLKKNCVDAFNSRLEKKFEGDESSVLFAFVFLYYQNNNDFNLQEFMEKKHYFDEKEEIEFELTEKQIFNEREVFAVKLTVEEKPLGTFYAQTESPYIIIYYKDPFTMFEFIEEAQEEFDREEYSCSD